MLEARHPHELAWKRSILNYEGISRSNPLDPRDEQVVTPFAFIFVEAKTSEEIKATKPYTFTAVEDSGDSWKVELLTEVKNHADRVRKSRALRHRAYRHKNLYGVGIVRKGYRRVMRTIRERIFGDEDGINFKYQKRTVPIYDDLFDEVVSPFNFAVDPNALTMDDAEDCAHFHIENWAAFQELYGNDERFKNIEHVKPGIGFKFGPNNSASIASPGKNQVLVCEYFNKYYDEWVIYANGIEIYEGPLADDHKELPFVSYHNHPNFATQYFSGFVKSPHSGQDVTSGGEVNTSESFWSKGDPEIIRDLIDLRTGFGRAMFRAAKLAGEVIITTAGNFKIDERKQWRSGDQIVGGMGKIAVQPLGSSNVGSFQFTFEDTERLMILATGVDPRNLAETKTKTATEAAIQRETSMRRLEENIEYNEEHGEIRNGIIDLANFQQYYSIPELVRLTGEEDIEEFHDVTIDPGTGKPMLGKRYRRIGTKNSYSERKRKKKDGTYKYTLSRSEEGVHSFLSRPEYIRSSQIDVAVDSGRRAGEIQALKIEQSFKAFELFLQAAQLVGQGMVAADDLPKFRYISEQVLEGLNWPKDKAMGQEVEKARQQEDATLAGYQPIPLNPPLAPPPMPEPTTPEQP